MARPHVTADGAQLRRKAVVINYLVWAVAVIVMVVSATTTANLMVQHHNSYAQGLALGLAVDASIAVSLIGDQLLQESGQRSRWGTALRWITAAMSLLLNCAQSFQDGDALGVALHAIPVVLLISLTEAAQDYQLMLGRNSFPPDTAELEARDPRAPQPVTDPQYPADSYGSHETVPGPAQTSAGSGIEYRTETGILAHETSTALVEMLTERSTNPEGTWEPELWDRAVRCAVEYRGATNKDVRVDDIQALGIGRNRATKLRQDVLAHLSWDVTGAGLALPPAPDDLVLAPLDLVVRHRDDTLARLRFTPDPRDTETLRRHLIDAIDTGQGRLSSWVADYALDIHRTDGSPAVLTFTAAGVR